jgi:hypothetical protein
MLAIAVVAFVGKIVNQPAATAGKNLDETANLASAPDTAPDTFREAVNSAVKASELGRSAKTQGRLGDSYRSLARSGIINEKSTGV